MAGKTMAVAATFWVLAALPARAAPAPPVPLDEFEDISGWSTAASEGARVETAHDVGRTGMALRIDFDLSGGGYVIVRKSMPVPLPPDYTFRFFVRGNAEPNTFELKLADRGGDNVWWYRQRDYRFPSEWKQAVVKKPRFEFAWGTGGGGPPRNIGSVEFAITAGQGGRGSVWIDDLVVVERDVARGPDVPPKVSASTAVEGREPDRLVDAEPTHAWRSGALAPAQWVLVDFVKRREYGGLVIDWDTQDYARSYAVETSDDGENWSVAYRSTQGNGGRDYIPLPDGESRYLRLDLDESSRGQGYEIRKLGVKPFEFSASPNQFFEVIARDAPTGTFPKYFSGKQSYWTVVGAPGDSEEALINEEGMLEVSKGSFSIEPFLYVNGRLIAWTDVERTQELAHGYLPIPSVVWRTKAAGGGPELTLRTTAFAAGSGSQSVLYIRYRVENPADVHRTETEQHVELFLALRPFQVLPPWQALNMVGGVAPVHHLLFENRTVWVNREQAVVSLSPPDRFGAATFEEGLITDYLAAGTLPGHSEIDDGLGYGSGALLYNLRIAPATYEDVYLAVPFHDPEAVVRRRGSDGREEEFNSRFDETARFWEAVLNRVEFQLPPSEAKLARTWKSTLAYIIANIDAAAIQPGSRNYARSWIRDGAITSSALLAAGCPREVSDFVRWFAGYQTGDGRVPCCIDRRGADSVPEHDSDGEFIFTVAEYYRYTRDAGFVNDLWKNVVRAADHLLSLRAQRLTEAYRQPARKDFYGLIPESISHEGYSSRPVHSYWDDFFALRGFKDAAMLAGVVGDEENAARYASARDAFRNDLEASIRAAMARHRIDFIPGSVELGDFDATSTAIAVVLGDGLEHLPAGALRRTFDKYYEHVEERVKATGGDDAYTPYELRNVEVFVRLGDRRRALELLRVLLVGQRPEAWNQWAEVVWRDPDAPRFIGDMPHTWVASSFIRALRTMFAYEREEDRSLVLAAGVPGEWLSVPDGVGVKRLPTQYGVLSYNLRREGTNAFWLRIAGDVTVPPGGFVILPPLPSALRAVSVNGKPVESFAEDQAVVREFPADVILEF